ncbi:S8 family peptidase [Sphingopyxis sp. GC21]|uniref:S8 family peptidase n=1 Tax=Sphingopyxis sp. GC21 TaxID=2933562 RepID=UPI0021E3F6AF|nr:S8 family peptidase [Sphingopyxis sp. GC21]
MPTSEVVVVFADDTTAHAARTTKSLLSDAPGDDGLSSLLGEFGVVLAPMFDSPGDRGAPHALDGGAAAQAAPDPEETEMARYFHAEVPDDKVDAFVARMREQAAVEKVYVKPPTFNPIAPFDEAVAAPAIQAVAPPGGTIPRFDQFQTYLAAAPGGIGAIDAWNLPGGRGANVSIIDIEGAWQFTHVDLEDNGGLAGGTAIDEVDWRNHGTAVLGEVIARHNGQGAMGIAPDARMAAVSHNGIGSAAAIDMASAQLEPGDILLLEMHRPGPRFDFTQRDDQRGYIAVEWWRDDFLAIRRAIKRGIIVVEAAGNGAEDLDDPLYDTPAADFTADWRNPFRGEVDSGAIIVGAGAPVSGHYGLARSRLGFSNHGKRVDCQGWGREVTTTGYGDLYAGQGEDEWFTVSFSGTSSASPIVTGAVAVLQGIAKARGRTLTPNNVRAGLRSTGTPQQAAPSAPLAQRIGNQPDIAAMIAAL